MTPFWSHSYGTRSRGGGADKWFSNGASDVEHFFSETPADIIRPGDFASGNITSMLQSNVLTAVTTPTYQQALTGAGDDPLGVGFTHETTDSFDAANNTIYDFNGIAFAWLYTYKLTTALTNLRAIAGKYASNNGHITFGANATTMRGKWDATQVLHAPPAVGTADYILQYQDPGVPRSGVYSVSNTLLHSFGSVGAYLAQGHVAGPSVLFTGAAASAVISARATDLPNWWSS